MKTLATTTSKGGWARRPPLSIWPTWRRRWGPHLLWDLDPQGAATYYFRVRPRIKGGGQEPAQGKGQAGRPDKGDRLRGP